MTDFGQVKTIFVHKLHLNANIGLIICPIAPLKVLMGPLDWVDHYIGVFVL